MRIGIVVAALTLLAVSTLTAQTTFTVNTTDDVDDGVCDATHCSLREAISAASGSAGDKVIAFAITGAGPHTIQPASQLPALTGSVTIDGTTEPDFAGTPIIELDGSNAGDAHGLSIIGSNNTIRGLVINRFALNGISLETDAAVNVVEGCYIGTDVAGSVALGNGNAGVMVGQAPNNIIGGTTAAARNVISGNIEGVTIFDVPATGNRVLGNYIGINAAGDDAIPNGVGVLLLAPGNTVGGTDPGAGNVISGNSVSGIDLGPPNATGNLIVGNLIGTDPTGSVAIANEVGVTVNTVASNTIGGTAAGARNIISGNVGPGIHVWAADSVVIEGNYIGTDITGSAALGNDVGVFVNGAAHDTIGGTTTGARNVISGNREGVTLWDAGATGNHVMGNYIGTNAAGTAAIPNDVGVAIYGPANTIGGTTANAGNLISGNTTQGIKIEDAGATPTNNLIAGNYIGTGASGSNALGNEVGVIIISSSGNTIGGTTAAARNIISGNQQGVMIIGDGATANQVLGNYMGTNAAGDAAVPNATAVLLFAPETSIGGSAEGAGNVLSGNSFAGIDLGEGTTGTVIQGNYIGVDASGLVALGNELGIFVNGASANTIGGLDSGAGNVISGNRADGIHVNGPMATGNAILGNYLGTDATGAAGLGSPGSAVVFWDGASDNMIGGVGAGAANVLAFNQNSGVAFNDDAGTGNVVRSNSIFSNQGLGIDLLIDGVTANDDGDADTGPNNLQNYPGLIAVSSDDGALVRVGLNSIPNSTYTIELFSSTVCHADGYGEGETPLKTVTLATDNTGNGTTTTAVSGDQLTGNVLTATASDANGNTSEFSRCAELTDFQVAVTPASRTVSIGQSASYTVTVSAEGGPFDLPVALSCSELPSPATCNFSPADLTPGASQASAMLTVGTAAPSALLVTPNRSASHASLVFGWFLGLLVLLGLAAGLLARQPGRLGPLLACVAFLTLLQLACGDDDGTGPTGGVDPGTYEFTVTGTWGSVEHSTTATLVIE